MKKNYLYEISRYKLIEYKCDKKLRSSRCNLVSPNQGNALFFANHERYKIRNSNIEPDFI